MFYVVDMVKVKMEELHVFESPLEISVGVGFLEGCGGAGQLSKRGPPWSVCRMGVWGYSRMRSITVSNFEG